MTPVPAGRALMSHVFDGFTHRCRGCGRAPQRRLISMENASAVAYALWSLPRHAAKPVSSATAKNSN